MSLKAMEVGNRGVLYKRTLFDGKTEPCFVTKSVRLNRTELSIGGFCSKSRDLAPRKGLGPGFEKIKGTVF